MNEIIIAVISTLGGAFLGWFVSIIQIRYTEWKVFQAKIYVIREKFDRIEFDKRVPTETIFQTYTDSLDDVILAVCSVKPYLFLPDHRIRLDALLKAYRNAPKTPAFTGTPKLPNYSADWFESPKEMRADLIRILDDMINVTSVRTITCF